MYDLFITGYCKFVLQLRLSDVIIWCCRHSLKNMFIVFVLFVSNIRSTDENYNFGKRWCYVCLMYCILIRLALWYLFGFCLLRLFDSYVIINNWISVFSEGYRSVNYVGSNDVPNGPLFISILLPNSEFWISNSKFRSLHYEFWNSEL